MSKEKDESQMPKLSRQELFHNSLYSTGIAMGLGVFTVPLERFRALRHTEPAKGVADHFKYQYNTNGILGIYRGFGFTMALESLKTTGRVFAMMEIEQFKESDQMKNAHPWLKNAFGPAVLITTDATLTSYLESRRSSAQSNSNITASDPVAAKKTPSEYIKLAASRSLFSTKVTLCRNSIAYTVFPFAYNVIEKNLPTSSIFSPILVGATYGFIAGVPINCFAQVQNLYQRSIEDPTSYVKNSTIKPSGWISKDLWAIAKNSGVRGLTRGGLVGVTTSTFWGTINAYGLWMHKEDQRKKSSPQDLTVG